MIATLSSSPRDAVLFAPLTLGDDVWSELIKAYEKVDPIAALPIHRRLVENQLVNASARRYRLAASRLTKMRKLAAGATTRLRSMRSLPTSARRIVGAHGSSRSSTAPAFRYCCGQSGLTVRGRGWRW